MPTPNGSLVLACSYPTMQTVWKATHFNSTELSCLRPRSAPSGHSAVHVNDVPYPDDVYEDPDGDGDGDDPFRGLLYQHSMDRDIAWQSGEIGTAVALEAGKLARACSLHIAALASSHSFPPPF